MNGLNTYRKDIEKAEFLLWHPEIKAGKNVSSARLLESGKEVNITLPFSANAIR